MGQLKMDFEMSGMGRFNRELEGQMLRQALGDVERFAAALSRLRLRAYQKEAAEAIVDSVTWRRGLSIVVMFPRQSGKNEVQAQIEAYLLALFHERAADMVKVSPTWKPQSLNAMRRLERVLDGNRLTRGRWRKEQGYIYRLGRARISFLSGAATSNVVGATASLLLECDEAQDVSPAKWDKEISPMAASTNATRVYWGTAWSADTLLGREMRSARELEKEDGVRRVFTLTADQVREEAPAYGVFVDGEAARLGRGHPLVRSQFYCEEIRAECGMFPAQRRALMGEGQKPGIENRKPKTENGLYAFLIDVAGEAEAGGELTSLALRDGRRDATALTIVELDLSGLDDPLAVGPIYSVVGRRLWTGTRHTLLYGQIKALAEVWQPWRVVIDATGVGAGLASFLGSALGRVVRPFIFSSKSKSELGWKFLAIVETGRFKDLAVEEGEDEESRLRELFFRQLGGCEMEAGGPGLALRWGTPQGRRDEYGEAMHDDLVISAALCAALEEEKWGRTESAVITTDYADYADYAD